MILPRNGEQLWRVMNFWTTMTTNSYRMMTSLLRRPRETRSIQLLFLGVMTKDSWRIPTSRILLRPCFLNRRAPLFQRRLRDQMVTW